MNRERAMRTQVRGIDHLVILVRDIDRAERSYRQLGFTLTPRGTHTLGSQNHCLMFGDDYLELLHVPKPHPVMAFFHDFLVQREGLAGIALATSDAQGLHRGLLADGVKAQAPVEFSRPVDLGDTTGDARFRVMQVAPSETPAAQVFACQHFTRELVWRPEFQSHPLGVTGIAGVLIASDAPAETAAAYGRILGSTIEQRDGAHVLDCGAAQLQFVDAEGARRSLPGVDLPLNGEPAIVAVRLRVADIDEAVRVLRSGGTDPLPMADGSVAVGADRAHGVAVVFTPQARAVAA